MCSYIIIGVFILVIVLYMDKKVYEDFFKLNVSYLTGITGFHQISHPSQKTDKVASVLPISRYPLCPIGITCNDYIGSTGCTGSYATALPQRKFNTFINVYSTMEQTIAENQPIIFDKNNCVSGKCFHVPNSGEIWIWEPGFYQVYMSIYQLDSGQFSLIKNGNVLIYGTTIGSIHGSILNNVCIFEIAESDISISFMNKKCCKIELINTSSVNSVSLYGSASSGNQIPQNTATITILQIK